MAELATIARPYAEALYKSAPAADGDALVAELDALASVAAEPQLQQFADNPKVDSAQVYDVMLSVARVELSPRVRNLLRAVIDNNRVAALPEIAEQLRALVNRRAGISEATVYSAFALDDAALADVMGALERRFGRRLRPTVVVDPELIGGIRVVVGDEVLDTSVAARLEQMKAALTA